MRFGKTCLERRIARCAQIERSAGVMFAVTGSGDALQYFRDGESRLERKVETGTPLCGCGVLNGHRDVPIHLR